MNHRALCLWLSLACGPGFGAADASRLYSEARRAEQAGDLLRAYALYAQAAAFEPHRARYQLRTQALREQLQRAFGTHRLASQPVAGAVTPPIENASLASAPAEATLAAPPALQSTHGGRSFDLRGDARTLFEQVAATCGLEATFDPDFSPGEAFRFRLDEAGCLEALRALEAATGSFVVPLSERQFLVARDTPAKRVEHEPVITAVIPLPAPVSLEEAQEVARAVQQTMGLPQVQLDSQRRLVSVRGRLSLVRPAQDLFRQLLRHRSQVMVRVEFLELTDSVIRDYGVSLPTLFPFVNFGDFWNHRPPIPAGFSRFAVFGGGATFLGVGVSDALAVARMSRSSGRTLLRAELRSVDGQPVSLHVGDRFPILTGAFLGQVAADVPLGIPPAITFEDLGLVLKITPRTHFPSEVSLELEAEFKVLTGEVIARIPVIATRRVQSTVRLQSGQWAVVAGLMSSEEARTVTGLAGPSRIPVLGHFFRQNSRSAQRRDVVLLLQPELLSLPPAAAPSPAIYLGSENRPRIPL
ncbi:MAG: type II and III secretion system protein [Bryobacterales bacterium]|nr:type II and III secretion system protein [Bryobacterales bacterium]